MKNLVLASVIFFLSPFSAYAANDIQFTANTSIQFLTKDSAVVSTITAEANGIVSHLAIGANFMDITLDNGSSVTFSTAENIFFNATVQAGSGSTINHECSLKNISLSSTGNTVVRIEMTSAKPFCDDETEENGNENSNSAAGSIGGGSISGGQISGRKIAGNTREEEITTVPLPSPTQETTQGNSSEIIYTNTNQETIEVLPVAHKVEEKKILPQEISATFTAPRELQYLPEKENVPSVEQQPPTLFDVSAEVSPSASSSIIPYLLPVLVASIICGIILITAFERLKRRRMLHKKNTP